jgi:hypothetical protein
LDGDLDLFVGTNAGELYYYRNDGSASVPDWSGVTSNYAGVAFGTNSHVSAAFADIDDDDDLDMFVQHYLGGSGDEMQFFENIGTASAAEWQLIDDDYMNVSSYDIGFGTCDFTDLDADGDLDCLLGDGGFSTFFFFENTGTAQSASWSYVGEIADGLAAEGQARYSSPAFADLNNDAWVDLVSGHDGGGLNLWLQGEPTPVELAEFEVVAVGRGVLVTWSTAMEDNVLGFQLFRRRSGAEWERLVSEPVRADRTYEYLDDTVVAGQEYDYALEAVDVFGERQRFGPISIRVPSFVAMSLAAHPNPSSDGVVVSFAIPAAGDVTIQAFDVLGRRVAEIVNDHLAAGAHHLDWTGEMRAGSGLSSGTYFLRIQAGGVTETVKVTLRR